MALGKIKELHPRDYWKNEALDFTPWLAEEENLRLLGSLSLYTLGTDRGH